MSRIQDMIFIGQDKSISHRVIDDVESPDLTLTILQYDTLAKCQDRLRSVTKKLSNNVSLDTVRYMLLLEMPKGKTLTPEIAFGYITMYPELLNYVGRVKTFIRIHEMTLDEYNELIDTFSA